MYNGHEYLSCIKINTSKQTAMKNTHEKAEPMDLTAEHRNLILTANKVFGEDKWSHTVVNQTLDFVEIIGAKCCTGCVSFVKVQLDNGNFHEDIGYYSAEESTKGLSIHNARVGSAVNALRRVLLSFGDKIEKELQQLQKQINSEQANNIQKSVIQSDEQISDKSNVLIKAPVSHVQETERTSEPEPNKSTNQLIKAPSLGSTINITSETNQSSFTNVQIDEPSSKKKNLIQEKLRQERKRKQMEKQMEFKRRMMEKEGLIDIERDKQED
ncbi:PREDICTED: DNA repair protein RAD52 homolog isoform X2 [Trachymyrmex septentrionalis]|uniref:DNA repair protein RAD52 homolog isoform X2 n=1 Tax=Trachymyrmex septentrionalis TaxID=34720 RepID=UPI00084EF526|nr:PREDICTED: DNA repair protein RAD52 homolog isoform X2 [Trachymyrmex septentrionalis]